MSDATHFQAIANFIALALAGSFALAALLHLMAPPFMRAAYQRWGYARSFRYAAGFAMGLAALFLAVQPLRIWGGALGGMILFITVTALLNRERYLYALPVILLLVALAPAMA